jgi:hypothetical protein
VKVSLIDIRDLRRKAKSLELVKANSADVLIIIGHGSRGGIRGLRKDDLATIPNAKILWIYACECGLELIHNLATKYKAVIGYVTEILAPASIESTVAYKVQKIIETYNGSDEPGKIISHVQDSLLRFALDLMVRSRQNDDAMGLLLFQAALVNHTRLSLRRGTPK